MSTERTKALRYRRAVFHTSPNANGPPPKSLEEYIQDAHAKITTSKNRVALFDGGYTLQMRYARKRRNVGTLLHLTAYTEKERASVVPHVNDTADEAPIDTAPPPRGAEYMDGDLLLLVSGNDVLICSSSLHDHKFSQYCTVIFNQAELPPLAALFELASVANVDKVAIIENEGVKSITLDNVMFAASVENVSRKSIRRTLGAGALELFGALFGKDADLDEIRTKENLSAQLVIKFDSRKTGGELGQERIDDLAKRLLNEPSDGFHIKTRSNTKIGHDDLSLQKMVRIPTDGKTVQRDAAFAELTKFLQELKDEGHIGA